MNNAHKMICWLILLNVCDLDAKWKAQAQFDTAESLAQCTTAQNNKKNDGFIEPVFVQSVLQFASHLFSVYLLLRLSISAR